MNKNAIQGRFWPSKHDGFTQINRVGQALSDSAPKGHPVVIKNSVILNLIQDLQCLLLPLRNSLRGRSRNKFGNYALFNERNDERGRYPAGRPIQYGMTPYLTFRGFTLIELLVVILIIGVLAAVALPQYQKAVMKSRFATLQLLGRTYERAAQEYIAANGEWPSNFSDLSIEPPAGLEMKNPTGGNCVQNEDFYCCLNSAVSGYQNSGITCGLQDYSLAYVYTYKSAANTATWNTRDCMAKQTNSVVNQVCAEYNTNRGTINLPTPTGHATGYYSYRMK